MKAEKINTVYALNRDKLKCRVCGGWLISSTPWAHRVNPYLPLDKVNRVNNLVSLHKKCFMAVNDPRVRLCVIGQELLYIVV